MAYGNKNQTNNKGFTSPYPPNITDDFNILNITGKNEQGGKAYFFVRFSGTKVRINVSTKVQGDKDDGKMKMDLNLQGWFNFLSLLEKVNNSEKRGKESVCYLETKFPRKEKMITAGRLYVGKEEDGMVWISLFQYERPKIKFFLIDDNYQSYCNSSGEKFSAEDSSKLLADAYVNIGRHLLACVATQEYKSENDRPAYGGNKANNNRNNQDFSSDDGEDFDF